METSEDAAHRRGEDILGVPISPDKIWPARFAISPAGAKMILLAMDPQRPLRPSWVMRLASDMRNKRWGVSHQGIAFDENGRLIDGQHRLQACIEAGVTIDVTVSFNVPRHSFAVIDRHQRRVMSDDLVTVGLVERKHSKNLATAIKIVWNIDSDRAPYISGAGSMPSISEASDVLARHPMLVKAAEYANQHQYRRIMPLSILTAFGALILERDESRAWRFLDDVVIGDGVRVGSPAHALRDMLMRVGDLRAKSQPAVMTGFVRAWNAYVAGRQLSKIDTSIRGSESFPEISRGK